MPSGFKIADAYVSVSLDRQQLRDDLAKLPSDLDRDVSSAGQSTGKKLGKSIGDGADGASVGRKVAADVDKELQPRAEKSGKDSGDKLSKGMEQSIIRNSPMIVAATSGVLLAGAPALLAGAGVLFAGIAAAAVHSNQQVQDAFGGLKTSITSTFSDAAQVTVPMFVGAMDRIGAAVRGLGPQLHTAFAALGPSVDFLTTGLIQMMQNVMPGLVSAVQNAAPVFQGLATLMAQIGSGLGQMFQIMSQHSQAAGTVMASLGQIIGSLLPILGQLIGAGAELGAAILPPIADVLHVVASAVNALAPVLPIVLGGFLAWKAIGPLQSMLQNIANSAKSAGQSLASAFSSGAVSGANVLTGVVTLVASAFMASRQQIDQWAQALLQGGNAASQASSQMQRWTDFLDKGASGVANNIFGITNMATAFGVGSNAMQNAKDRAKELYDAMSPLQQKQQDVTTATNDLQQMIQKYGVNSGQAVGASVALKEKQEDLKRAQDDLALATDGVRKSIIDEANAAYGAINSAYGYKDAQYQQRDAANALAQAIKEHGKQSDQAAQAETRLEEAAFNTAQAFGRMAADQLPATASAQEKAAAAAKGTLQELIRLRDQAQGPLRDALNQMIQTVQASGANLDNLGTKHPTPTVRLDTLQFDGKAAQTQAAIGSLNSQRPTPTANLNPNPFYSVVSGVSGYLNNLAGRMTTTAITAIAYTSQAEQWLDYVARNRTVTVNVIGKGAIATGGSVGMFAGARGFADGGEFSGQIRGPGGPTDDLVNAISDGGVPLRVSNTEWVINSAVSQAQGYGRMSLLNAGMADIVPRPRASVGAAASGTVTAAPAGGVTIHNLNVTVAGVDFTDRHYADRVAGPIRDAIRRVERAQQ